MDERKRSPLERVAQALAENRDIEISAHEATQVLSDLLDDLRDDCHEALQADPNSFESLKRSQRYWAVAEILKQFGNMLVGFEDLDELEVN